MDNIRIAVRDSTDSYNVAFFDNEAGIKFKTPNLTKFLAGSASMLSLSFNSKDIDTVKTGCKLSFVYKNKPYWLNIMDIQKNGFKMDLIAYSLVLEINNEQKGSYKSDKAQSIAKYVRIFDPENSLTIGINEVADKSIKLEWTGTNTLLDRLYSIANRFDAEFEFVTETNSDYSLRRHVLNIYRKGNLGKDLTGQPVRVGKDLKVINYSDNIKELYSAVHATGKDGLTIAGLTKTVNDDAGKPLYVTDGAYLRAPQTRNRFPSVGRNSTDNYLLLDLDSTEYETKEALYGYMLAELKKASVPKVSYTAEGSMDGEVGDKMTLIDDLHYDPPLYVQGRISEMTEDIITGRVTETTFTNYERKYSQLSDDLLKRVEELA
ncbi:phage tail protein, partial [Collinsella sp. LCP19S3_B11]